MGLRVLQIDGQTGHKDRTAKGNQQGWKLQKVWDGVVGRAIRRQRTRSSECW